ncbi:aspartyl/glutamyl-tRNA(Asn/Gln) amidotransferase subunit B [Hypnocyclicus thermotrophus]|uniref:Aspartyl/glutamyl-tRNA(Asn/Gln) amidotransferase subunit B n=1 Tax=Hypnocyclicus thermotrophus TaxID=1627895 RepID=A0AA46DZW6_9FUSO|nr:Asp-tRNA(Asn)/Glu-tRNA(Gln) amidotransferase subunit GatB [Hypnocyclicus thermotrophus]TDT72245.1 aspartyl/glutamyl-tRNA(Asn/Gln) amidotransferase subunit B [Hypnocyclicus thermotrophus]
MTLETIIGLEIHVELDTKTKIFCNCSTKFGKKPNENTCPICLGLPGTLPVMNERVIELAVKAGLAINCNINTLNKMDRKNYFYPDLPKAYQISQYDLPICQDGYVDIETEQGSKRIRINRIHMEEDAGKLVHDEFEPVSYIDYNRVGVPLIEIVTEPDIRSIDEAIIFLKTLKNILEYADISDCKMEEGSLRCDANISMRKVGDTKLNTRVELKNINSFKELEKALLKEQKRQSELYKYGEDYKIIQETRRWDSAKGKTIPMRGKEEAHDYRYFPEPDIIPLIVKNEILENAKASLPELPSIKKERFIKDYALTETDASIIVADKYLANYFEDIVKEGADAKNASNWILRDVIRILNEQKIEAKDFNLPAKELATIIKLTKENKINSSSATLVFDEILKTNKTALEIIEEKSLLQSNDSSEIEAIVDKVIFENENVVKQYKEGNKKVLGFLVGQIMKATKGKVNPKIANEILSKKLN